MVVSGQERSEGSQELVSWRAGGTVSSPCIPSCSPVPVVNPVSRWISGKYAITSTSLTFNCSAPLPGLKPECWDDGNSTTRQMGRATLLGGKTLTQTRELQHPVTNQRSFAGEQGRAVETRELDLPYLCWEGSILDALSICQIMSLCHESQPLFSRTEISSIIP